MSAPEKHRKRSERHQRAGKALVSKSSPARNEPALPLPARPRRRRRWLWVVGTATLLFAAVGAGWLYWMRSPPPPPEIATAGFDPAIVAAIENARLAIARDPRSAEARGHLGMLLLAHEIRAPARECFTQAAAMAPREPRWPYFRGLAQLMDNPMSGAADLEHAVQLFPENAMVPRLKLAATLITLGQLDRAEFHYRFVLKHEPESAAAALGLGKIANAQDRVEEAAGFLLRATENPTTRKAAHRLLLTAYQKLGRTEESKLVATKLAGLPNDMSLPDSYLAEVEKLKTGEHASIDLGDELIKAGRAPEAVPLLEKTIREYPQSVRAMFFLGRARLRSGDTRGAESILIRAVELDPNSIEAQLQLGVTRMSSGRPADAEPCFRAAIQAKPNLAAAWFNLALSMGENPARRSESIQAFREAIRLKPDLVEAYLGLAIVLRAVGQPQLAVEELRRALSLEPNEPLRSRLLDQLKLAEKP